MGGSDQWGNIVNGIDLGRRMGTEQLYALTCPLITTSSGAKMGKTAQGAVWLNADQLSPYEYWQFWRNTEDADVGRFLRLFTELPLDEIARLGAAAGRRDQRGEEGAGDRGDGAPARRGGGGRRRRRPRGAPSRRAAPAAPCRRSRCRAPSSRPASAARRSSCAPGLAASNGEVRRAVANKAVRVNDVPVADPQRIVGAATSIADGVIKLSLGRKKHALVVPAVSAQRYSKILRKMPGAMAEIGFIVSCGSSSGPNSL